MSLLDNLFNTIVILFQLIQTKITVKITNNTEKINKLKEGKTLAIGFTIPQEEEECEDD